VQLNALKLLGFNLMLINMVNCNLDLLVEEGGRNMFFKFLSRSVSSCNVSFLCDWCEVRVVTCS
jgi:hypothetical protein